MLKKITIKNKKNLYCKCTHCGDEIFWNTHKKLIECTCKAIFVDGCEDYIRIGGKRKEAE